MRTTLLILCSVIDLTSGVSVLPDIVNASLGGSVTFTPSLNQPTEHPFITIVWSFGTVNIITHSASSNITNEQYRDRITLFTSTGSLELRNLAESDAGEYLVTIVTVEGGGTSGSTDLKTYEKIDNSIVQPATPPVEGSSVKFTCEASGSIPSREWKFNGIELKPSGNIVFYDEKRILSFTILTRKDNGKYTCIISNPVSSQSVDYTMKANYGPENVKISGPEEIEERATLTLSCSADSEPAAKYTWTKNGTTVGQSSEYTKQKISSSDSGVYICRATNEITARSFEVSHVVNVTGLAPPVSDLSTGAIAGITVASLVVVAGAAAGGFYLFKHKKNRKEMNNGREPEHIYENTSNTGDFNMDEENKHVYENSRNVYDRKL